jgi:hypothetical protein
MSEVAIVCLSMLTTAFGLAWWLENRRYWTLLIRYQQQSDKTCEIVNRAVAMNDAACKMHAAALEVLQQASIAHERQSANADQAIH